MTRRMLINAQKSEQVRVAVISNSTLENFQVEVAERGLTRGNIYRGIIVSIQPSLNAAFIDYGGDKDGFLSVQDLVPAAYYREPKEKGRGRGRVRIEEVLDRNRPIVVQVVKEPGGSKGAVLTTNLSLAGRYLVVTPFDDTRGVSRKLEDDEQRKRLKQLANELSVPSGCGVIVRTNALGQNKRDLNRDLNALLRLWRKVSTEARRSKGTKLIYSDQDLILRALRDHLDSSMSEILIDDDAAYEKAQEYFRAFMPRGKIKLERYNERTPLFHRFGLEAQIDRIFDRTVELPSGGSIVIDATEALTAIDVNSGRATKGGSQEETALTTNLEAAREVARQLRLRDIGGLLVVDFIDMRSRKNQRAVEKELKEALKEDKARATIGRISGNGLLEINRQQIQQPLYLRTHRDCPTCGGTGRIPSRHMVSVNLLRRIEARATSGPLSKVRISLHPELADAFQNDHRRDITAIEREFDITVEIIASNRLHRADQEIEWFKREEAPEKVEQAGGEPAVRASQLATGPGGGRGRKQSQSKQQSQAKGDSGNGKPRPRRRRRRRRSSKGGGKQSQQTATSS